MSRLGRLLNPETRESQELRVQLPPTEAIEACRDAVHAIGWEAVSGSPEGRLTAREDIAKLCCGDSPVRLEIELQPENGGRHSVVNVEAFVAGVGGVATKHLHIGMRAFALSLARQGRAAPG